jgi:hypothetical protein
MSKASGCEHVAVGKFGRLFGAGSGSLTEQEAAAIGGPGGPMHDFDGTSPDSGIPAGYIFFAQFIDHDITLDTTSNFRDDPQSVTVEDLPNIRSASLDLDCIYGFGPEASPHIYDANRPGHIALHPNGYDLARDLGGRALIGDPRNDEISSSRRCSCCSSASTTKSTRSVWNATRAASIWTASKRRRNRLVTTTNG